MTDRPTLTRNSTIWLNDGNIVLRAQGDVFFRAHKSVLALHSEFFNAMFDQSLPIPHGSDDDARIDGCPVIPLEDTAYDFRQLLLVVYGKKYALRPHGLSCRELLILSHQRP
ncbi:hypothetical protein FKP32DRAFT_1558331 [Trametes sanguinea]|nr:hypothetical protein FKP32DRAFT_1558331 [Trametes sanguinea]